MFKKPSRTPDPNEAFAIPPGLRDAIATLNAAVEKRADVDAAIARNGVGGADAERDHAAAKAVLENLEIDLAMETDLERSRSVEGELAKATITLQQAADAGARVARVRVALFEKAREADSAIDEAKQNLEALRVEYVQSVQDALRIELLEAVKALTPVMARACALHAHGLLAFNAGVFADLRIPNPINHNTPLADGSKITDADGAVTDLMATWRENTSATALAHLVKPLEDIRRRAAMHANFAPPSAASGSYNPDPRNSAAVRFNREFDERDRAEADRLHAVRLANRDALVTAEPKPSTTSEVGQNQRAAAYNAPIEAREQAERDSRNAERLAARNAREATHDEMRREAERQTADEGLEMFMPEAVR